MKKQIYYPHTSTDQENNCFNFVYICQMYIHVLWSIFKFFYIVLHGCLFFQSLQIPQSSVHGRQLPFFPSGGIILMFFFIKSDP